MGWLSGGPSRVLGGCVLGLAQVSAFTITVPLAEERDAGMLAGGFQRWLLGIPKSKAVITSPEIGGDGCVGGGGRTILSGYGGICELGG